MEANFIKHNCNMNSKFPLSREIPEERQHYSMPGWANYWAIWKHLQYIADASFDWTMGDEISESNGANNDQKRC